MEFGLFCSCGAVAEGEILPDPAADKLMVFWREIHQGPGHRSCTRKEATEAMMRAERDHFAEKR